MDPVLLELAKARAASRDRREPFIRISKELLAEVVARLMDMPYVEPEKTEEPAGGPEL